MDLQEQVQRLWKELEQVGKGIKLQELELKAALTANIPDLIRILEKGIDCLSARQQRLDQQLSALQLQQAAALSASTIDRHGKCPQGLQCR